MQGCLALTGAQRGQLCCLFSTPGGLRKLLALFFHKALDKTPSCLPSGIPRAAARGATRFCTANGVKNTSRERGKLSPESGIGFFADARALALPLIILAQLRLVLLHLGLQLAERFLAASAHRGGFPRGVQRSRRQGQRKRARNVVRPRIDRKPTVQLDQ